MLESSKEHVRYSLILMRLQELCELWQVTPSPASFWKQTWLRVPDPPSHLNTISSGNTSQANVSSEHLVQCSLLICGSCLLLCFLPPTECILVMVRCATVQRCQVYPPPLQIVDIPGWLLLLLLWLWSHQTRLYTHGNRGEAISQWLADMEEVGCRMVFLQEWCAMNALRVIRICLVQDCWEGGD